MISFFWSLGLDPTHPSPRCRQQPNKAPSTLTALGPQPCSTHIPSGPPCWGPLHRLALIIDWTVQTLLHSASCAVCRCRCLFLGIPRSSRCGQAAAVGWDASDHWKSGGWPPNPSPSGSPGRARHAQPGSPPASDHWNREDGLPTPHRGRSPGQARHAQPGSPLLGPQSRRKAQRPL